MVLCFIAMFVFGVLGVFSLKYRYYAKEAFKCSFRLVTLRPCQSDFDQKIKTKILSRLMKFPKIARLTNKYFTAVSVLLVTLFFCSLVYTGYSIYNLAVYKSCDPKHPENCLFTPIVNITKNLNANICIISGDFIEFYGAECPHCIKMKTVVEQVEKETGIIFQKLEVWHNETNQKTMLTYAEDIQHNCGILGVPAFYATKTKKAICGEKTVEELKDFIRKNG